MIQHGEDQNRYMENKKRGAGQSLPTRKLELLGDLEDKLRPVGAGKEYIEALLLEKLKLWLEPLDNQANTKSERVKSLPNSTLVKTLQLISQLPVTEQFFRDFPGSRAICETLGALMCDTENYKNDPLILSVWEECARILVKWKPLLPVRGAGGAK